jgi:hypothetical protein
VYGELSIKTNILNDAYQMGVAAAGPDKTASAVSTIYDMLNECFINVKDDSLASFIGSEND